MKFLLGDLSAKEGRKNVFIFTVGNKSLHGISTDNGVCVVSFTMSENLIVMSTTFTHHSMHKYT
jgi:hypothetical protein